MIHWATNSSSRVLGKRINTGIVTVLQGGRKEVDMARLEATSSSELNKRTQTRKEQFIGSKCDLAHVGWASVSQAFSFGRGVWRERSSHQRLST